MKTEEKRGRRDIDQGNETKDELHFFGSSKYQKLYLYFFLHFGLNSVRKNFGAKREAIDEVGNINRQMCQCKHLKARQLN